ncbi:MAG TPA: hypothetical protein VGN97_21965 [Mesorhizobium sp.]|jgi:hypothetical protein|nr:hypothetical protein [Mesorhizobium sp.]
MNIAAPFAEDPISAAAKWLATTPRDARGGPVVPALRERFGLSPGDAIEAIRQAVLIRARSM